MRRAAVVLTLCFMAVLSVGCATNQFAGTGNYVVDMQTKLNMYKKYSYWKLAPALKMHHLPYPPKQLALIVIKNTKTLELWAKGQGAWQHVKDYRILAASGHPGPKLRNGDRQVPEGIYHIEGFNPNSHFDLSMQLNYPNAFDRKHARLDGRHNLGGDIFIHGKDRSIGCIAIGDSNIEQIFVLAYLVGQDNIEVIVAPNDLRYQKPIYTKTDPQWTSTLYANIKKALVPFV